MVSGPSAEDQASDFLGNAKRVYKKELRSKRRGKKTKSE